MTDHAQIAPHPAHLRYVLVWAVLVLLFVASVAFSAVTSVVVGVVFAFFIATVKALMVAAWFMHLNVEKRWVWWVLGLCLLVVFVLWLGVAPDVMEHGGVRWSKLPAR
jgi:caa(3)-type oxidase subunit IV